MTAVDLARAEIRALQPYSSARMEASGGAIALNANESPWPAPSDSSGALNRYPDPQPVELVARLAGLYGVTPAQILVGRGSDEAIDLLVRAFCRAGEDAVLIAPPTFGMYAVCARIQGAQVVAVQLTADFELDAGAVIARATDRVKLVFLCSPNNPTGGLIAAAAIARIAAALAGRALVVVDEAYVEFAAVPSAAALLGRFDNLAVLRTLSKAHALAGARIGTLLAAPEVIALLRRIMPPYPLSTLCVNAALAALAPTALAATSARIAAIVDERERLAREYARLPQVRAVLASAANFLTVRVHDAAKVYRDLLAAGVVVRDVSRQCGLANCLRISIGTQAHNDRVLDLLAAYVEAA